MQLFGLNPTPASSRYFEQVFAIALYFQDTQFQLYSISYSATSKNTIVRIFRLIVP